MYLQLYSTEQYRLYSINIQPYESTYVATHSVNGRQLYLVCCVAIHAGLLYSSYSLCILNLKGLSDRGCAPWPGLRYTAHGDTDTAQRLLDRCAGCALPAARASGVRYSKG